MKLKKLEIKGEQYIYDDNYILEVWTIEGINNGRHFDFYLTSRDSTRKLFMYGMRMFQPSENKLYTKVELIKMAMHNVELYIEEYEDMMREEGD